MRRGRNSASATTDRTASRDRTAGRIPTLNPRVSYAWEEFDSPTRVPMRHESILVTDVPTPAPSEPASTPADPYVAPVEQTLAAARTQAAKRRARWADPKADVSEPKRSSPSVPVPPPRGRILKCRVCGRAEPRSAGDIRRLARGAWPTCCGQVMPPVLEPSTDPSASDDGDDLPWADRRVNDRRKARIGTRAEVRRGVLGMSPDLALKLVDVSEGGVQVRLVSPARAGEQVQIALWPPGNAQSIRGPGVICWCLPTPTGEFRAGLRLRRRLAKDVVDLLAE